MLNELSISTLINEGGVYINLAEFCLHLLGSGIALDEQVAEGVDSGVLSDNDIIYYHGQMDAIRSIGTFLAEAGMVEIFNAELENV